MRGTPVKGCWAKTRYATREVALLGAENAAREYGRPFRVYPCRDRRGRHFHITSTAK